MSSYSIIIRGPAGVGKTTIGKMLTKKLEASYISVDKVLKKHKLDYVPGELCVPEENCVRSNKLMLPKILSAFRKGKPIVIEGCFYHKSQIENLLEVLPNKAIVFTLKAKIPELVARDKTRRRIGEESIRAVHKLSSQFDYGIIIDTNNKNKIQIIKEIISFLPK